MNLKEIDQIEITSLVDNYTDLLRTDSTPVIKRPSLPYRETLFAEHGLSLFITIWDDGDAVSILMDAGASDIALLHNSSRLGVPMSDISAMVISHGHDDHMGGMKAVFQHESRSIPVYIHPGSLNLRQKRIPGHPPIEIEPEDVESLIRAGAGFIFTPGPTRFCHDRFLITGEVERSTEFELTNPVYYIQSSGTWTPDLFHDDQALIFHLKGKGLVIITGCAHAGIINTVRYARKITGVNRIHAVIGGFHLSGPFFKPIIEPTIMAMKTIDPAFVVPMHCTGWEGITRFMEEMPDQVLLNTVGTSYMFG